MVCMIPVRMTKGIFMKINFYMLLLIMYVFILFGCSNRDIWDDIDYESNNSSDFKLGSGI